MYPYYIKERKSPLDETKANYCTSCTPQVVGIEKIVEHIVGECTCTRADIKACVNALQTAVGEQLQDNHSVSLGDLGCISATIKSKGQTLQKDVTTNDCKKIAIRFRPSSVIRDYLSKPNNVSYLRCKDKGGGKYVKA